MPLTLLLVLGGLVLLGSISLTVGETVTRTRARRTVETARERASLKRQSVESFSGTLEERLYAAAVSAADTVAAGAAQKTMGGLNDVLKQWEEDALHVGDKAAKAYAHGLREYLPTRDDIVALHGSLEEIQGRLTNLETALASGAEVLGKLEGKLRKGRDDEAARVALVESLQEIQGRLSNLEGALASGASALKNLANRLPSEVDDPLQSVEQSGDVEAPPALYLR